MKDEIKEILDNLKNIEDYLSFSEASKLLDYITNLQKERNMFKGSFETMSKNYFEEKSKIDKAIKYLVLCYDTHFQNNTEEDRLKLLNAIKMLNGNE